MAGKKQLPPVRIVSEDERAAGPPPTLREAFNQGDRLYELRAKRRILIAHIESETTLARDLAALMRQDNDLSRQIEEIEALADAEDESSSSKGGGATSGTADAKWRPQAI